MLLFNKRLVIESGFSMIEVLFSIAIV
ncbi:hypothetical protein COT94_00720, partial [Candidatus Falkowbacteria bacterium CG10_big_fil_rev_8_21_14_0_10_37_14]